MLKIFTNTPKLFILSALCLFVTSCGVKPITESKDINEANAMIVALKESGIDADRSQSGDLGKEVYKVMVEDGFFSTGAEREAMRILTDNCLPYKPPTPIAEGGMGVPSASVESEKRKRQAQMDLDQLFRAYKGVTCVKSILVYPEKSIDSLEPFPSSATIHIRYKKFNPALTVDVVRAQTAGAVEKLNPANVSVVLEPVDIEPAQLNSSESWKKLFITGGVAIGLIGVLMIFVLWMRKRKPPEEEYEDETDLLEENELNLLESGEDE
jgi:type III secretory pathway lipoprotein EscJ